MTYHMVYLLIVFWQIIHNGCDICILACFFLSLYYYEFFFSINCPMYFYDVKNLSYIKKCPLISLVSSQTLGLISFPLCTISLACESLYFWSERYFTVTKRVNPNTIFRWFTTNACTEGDLLMQLSVQPLFLFIWKIFYQ